MAQRAATGPNQPVIAHERDGFGVAKPMSPVAPPREHALLADRWRASGEVRGARSRCGVLNAAEHLDEQILRREALGDGDPDPAHTDADLGAELEQKRANGAALSLGQFRLLESKTTGSGALRVDRAIGSKEHSGQQRQNRQADNSIQFGQAKLDTPRSRIGSPVPPCIHR